MDGTPKLKKRKSLTLGQQRKCAASPKSFRPKSTTDGFVSVDNCTISRTMKSPSTKSTSSDGGIECTPPHKKLSLDDSIDYSPKCFDTSFSPSCLLSQSLASDSPEVGWKWGRRNTDECVGETATTTPDSAYAADSSFTSAGSTSTEVTRGTALTRNDQQSQRFAYELQREEHRKKREMQLRRAAKMRTDEVLRQRYAKLQEQLRDADARKQKEKEKENHPLCALKLEEENSLKAESKAVVDTINTEICIIDELTENMPTTTANETLNDFFNDSDSDGLLLAATQQVESKIIELTQAPIDQQFIPTQMPTELEQQNIVDLTKNAATPTRTTRQDKRSSLYMKFLEDDSPDDWFLSLDDVILQATQQATKSRNSFQRCNSMPTDTKTTLATSSHCETHTTNTSTTATSTTSREDQIATTKSYDSTPKMKRHASSHAIRPASSALSSVHRGARQLHMRK